MRKFLLGMAATAFAAIGFATSSQAVTLFQFETNFSNDDALNLANLKDSSSTTGTVISPNDVAITVVGNADFASGEATIKPIKDGILTTLTFTPTNPNLFDSFSFRGQDLVANQVINVIIQDNQGNAPQTLTFTESNANADFDRVGIVAALAGETIKWVEISNSGGFKESKQFAFDPAVGVQGHGGVPEPATWLMLIAGFGLVGAAARYGRINLVRA
jgi:PEP-CTERM motif